MAIFSKGNFKVSLGFVELGGEFSDIDRQCAWELYCELMTRVAVRGKVNSNGEDDFSGEILAESLDSVYRFFQESRAIMKRFPVGRIWVQDHLGFFIARMLEVVVRPFLEKWQASYRHFWQNADQQLAPFVRQQQYPRYDELTDDWTSLRRFCRETAKELATAYGLVDVMTAMPSDLRNAYLEETRNVMGGSV